jgi:metal-responsive CopG/Arc/MetJ family transcriptional regulator
MEILSISIDREALERLNGIQKRLGFKSRSKLFRNAVLDMLKDYEALDALSGRAESIFVITYPESESNHVSSLLHRFKRVVRSEIHQHNSNVCFDILDIDADAKDVRALFGVLKKTKCIYSVTYSLIPASAPKHQ